ncbi:MAG TPA: MFS transporter [Bacteroidia bacterium]|nr:MFS transporter [Bacteroidia bacterium]
MTAFDALRVKPFRQFVTARFFLIFSVQMQNLILSWLIYDITKDPLSLGLIGIAEIIPFLSVVLFAGNMADKFSRKKMVFWSTFLIFVASAFLYYLSVHQQNFKANILLSYYYSFVVILGLARGFFGPASQSMVPTLVPADVFANATTWNTTAFHVASILGPAIGGLIFGFGGASYSMPVIVFLQIISLVLYFGLKYEQNYAAQSKEPIWERLKGGFKFVFTNQVIINSLSLDLFAVLFGGATALLPVFAAEVYHCGAQGLGILRSAPAAGAVLMAVILMWKPPGKGAGKILLASVAAFGLCMIVFALSKNLYLSIIVLAISGAVDNVSVVIRQTLVQMNTPDEMRGRVASVNSVFISLSNEIGSFESGLAAKIFGLVPSVIYGGLATIGVVGITAKIAPKLREMDM